MRGSRELLELLRALPEASQTSAALGCFLASGSAELVALLKRQKITWSLFERCRASFQDP